MLLAAALLLSAAAPAPPPSVTAIGVARARILRPVAVTSTGQRASDGTAPLVTHQRPRRDGALVVDCY